MLRYLRTFPLQQHHPKEERYLHRLLRQRVPDSEPLLTEIESEHVERASMIEALMGLLHAVPSRHSGWDTEVLVNAKALADAT